METRLVLPTPPAQPAGQLAVVPTEDELPVDSAHAQALLRCVDPGRPVFEALQPVGCSENVFGIAPQSLVLDRFPGGADPNAAPAEDDLDAPAHSDSDHEHDDHAPHDALVIADKADGDHEPVGESGLPLAEPIDPTETTAAAIRRRNKEELAALIAAPRDPTGASVNPATGDAAPRYVAPRSVGFGPGHDAVPQSVEHGFTQEQQQRMAERHRLDVERRRAVWAHADAALQELHLWRRWTQLHPAPVLFAADAAYEQIAADAAIAATGDAGAPLPHAAVARHFTPHPGTQPGVPDEVELPKQTRRGPDGKRAEKLTELEKVEGATMPTSSVQPPPLVLDDFHHDDLGTAPAEGPVEGTEPEEGRNDDEAESKDTESKDAEGSKVEGSQEDKDEDKDEDDNKGSGEPKDDAEEKDKGSPEENSDLAPPADADDEGTKPQRGSTTLPFFVKGAIDDEGFLLAVASILASNGHAPLTDGHAASTAPDPTTTRPGFRNGNIFRELFASMELLPDFDMATFRFYAPDERRPMAAVAADAAAIGGLKASQAALVECSDPPPARFATIDTLLPMISPTALATSSTPARNEFWLPLLAKAYATVHHREGLAALHRASPIPPLRAMTAGVPTMATWRRGDLRGDSVDELWWLLRTAATYSLPVILSRRDRPVLDGGELHMAHDADAEAAAQVAADGTGHWARSDILLATAPYTVDLNQLTMDAVMRRHRAGKDEEEKPRYTDDDFVTQRDADVELLQAPKRQVLHGRGAAARHVTHRLVKLRQLFDGPRNDGVLPDGTVGIDPDSEEGAALLPPFHDSANLWSPVTFARSYPEEGDAATWMPAACRALREAPPTSADPRTTWMTLAHLTQRYDTALLLRAAAGHQAKVFLGAVDPHCDIERKAHTLPHYGLAVKKHRAPGQGGDSAGVWARGIDAEFTSLASVMEPPRSMDEDLMLGDELETDDDFEENADMETSSYASSRRSSRASFVQPGPSRKGLGLTLRMTLTQPPPPPVDLGPGYGAATELGAVPPQTVPLEVHVFRTQVPERQPLPEVIMDDGIPRYSLPKHSKVATTRVYAHKEQAVFEAEVGSGAYNIVVAPATTDDAARSIKLLPAGERRYCLSVTKYKHGASYSSAIEAFPAHVTAEPSNK